MSNGNGSGGRGPGSEFQRALSTLRRQLAALPGKKRMEALLEARDAQALVRALPAEDLYFTLMEVGLEDAGDLVQMASSEQFRTFVDLGAWKRDELSSRQVLAWLRAARGDAPEPFLQKLRRLDTELLELIIRSFTVIHDLQEDPDVNPQGVTMETPENRYLVEFKDVEGAELEALRTLLKDLIAENPFEAVRLLEATRWEVPGEMEEAAYRFRSARLHDLGFPPLEDAVQLFSRVDPGPSPAPAPGSSPGSSLAPSREQPNYLEAAFRELDEVERENLEAELRALANAALVAEVEEPGDLGAIQRVGEMARDYLLLGLEHLTGGDPARAAQVVRDLEIRRIFQVGFSLTLALKFRADRLMKQPLAQVEGVPLLFPEETAALEALRRKRPRRALKVPGAEAVPFRSRRELASSEAVLSRAEAQVELLGALLGGTPERAREGLARFPEEPRVLGWDRFFAAAVALALVEGTAGGTGEGGLTIRPLPRALRDELGRRLFEGTPAAPRLRPGVAERVLEVLQPLVPGSAQAELRRRVDMTLGRLLEEVGPAFLQEGRVDSIASLLLPMEGTPP